MLASSAKIILRPLGQSLHADKPNHLIHFEYSYIGPSNIGDTYVLIIKDEFSSYVWLVPCHTADASTNADGLIRWFAALKQYRSGFWTKFLTLRTRLQGICRTGHMHLIISL